jgi:hypothetical protein
MNFCACWLNLFADLLRFLFLGLRSRSSLAAENLFLRKQLAFYQERRIKPRRISHPMRLTLLWLSRRFDWRSALTVVRTRLSRSASALPRAGATPAASLRPAQPRGGAPRLERTSP